MHTFIKHYKKIQNEKGLILVNVRSDYGGELKIIVLNHFVMNMVMAIIFFAFRTPQQNGIVERKNHTLKEMARTMLCENNLPKYF